MENCPNISDCPYVTGITNRFTIPTDSGGVPTVAIEIGKASLIISLYTLMTVCIFLVGWGLLVAVIATFSPNDPRSSRYIPLVVMWNSNGPSSAALMMLEHCRRIEAERKKARLNKDSEVQGSEGISVRDLPQNRGAPFGENEEPRSNDLHLNLWWGVLFFVLSYSVWIGHLSAGLFITSQLWIGNFAPINPSHIFYPNLRALVASDDGLEKLSILKNPSALRALGAVETSNLTVMKRVRTKRLEPPEGQTTGLWAGLSYSYNITGVDMGLQSDPKLKLIVEGSCHTDLTRSPNPTDEEDTYRIWGGNNTFKVKHTEEESNLPPIVVFFTDQKPFKEKPSNLSYAMIIKTAGRYSISPSQDPWYATEISPIKDVYKKLYRILPKRPVLSCWEAKRWRLNGKEVKERQLEELPGLNLHRFWIEDAFLLEFELPGVVGLGRTAGQSALKSSSFGSSLYGLFFVYVLDSGSSGVLDDLERLVRASWISGGNVLRDTITYNPRDMKNSARRPDGSVEPSIAQFVLESRDVGALSVRVLVAVPIILILLLIVRLSLAAWIKHKNLVTLPSIHDLIDDATKSRPGPHNNHVTLTSSAQASKE
ncbi:hypothetical protein HOY80DRAFT_1140496 [Tuber brumale]|nr:hypothetical protein HOY80DRAFT_1140496 [Tuber brumale]